MNYHLKTVISKLSTECRTALDAAISHAVRLHHIEITSEHLLSVLIDQESRLFLHLEEKTGLSYCRLEDALNDVLGRMSTRSDAKPVFSEKLVMWLIDGWILASAQWGREELDVATLVASLLDEDRESESVLTPLVSDTLCCDRPVAINLLEEGSYLIGEMKSEYIRKITMLDKYTRNLSSLARNGCLDPVLGREKEIREIVDILLRRRQNNPVLTGDPGVGKTALVEGLALRITSGSVPDQLRTVEIYTLDLGMLQAGASVRGEFENRLQALLKEINNLAHPVILFIDEAHMLIGAGGEAGQNDAANLLKPALARGELRIIAATTWREYKKYFEKDGALARRFQVVNVTEPDIDDAIVMLRGLAPAISRYHGIEISESAIHAAVRLSHRFMAGRHLPDKSVTLLDTACARVAVSRVHEPRELEAVRANLMAIHREFEALKHENVNPDRQNKLQQMSVILESKIKLLEQYWNQQRDLAQRYDMESNSDEKVKIQERLQSLHRHNAMVFTCVDATSVADVVSEWTGIPLGRMLEKETENLTNILEQLDKRIIGQDYALNYITQKIIVSKSGMGDPLKPTGVFMLAGPSGTGKTETALKLAELLFGGESGLVRINMAEYQESHSVSGLKGSPPGYIGFGQGGVLTEAVRRNPYSVVLLDEVEKAHPDVMELFYQVFDKGMIEDAEGQTVNFRNTLIILTSNLGSSLLTTCSEDYKKSPESICSLIRPEFEKVFGTALMGRMTLLPFFPLDTESIKKIVDMKLAEVGTRYIAATNGLGSMRWSKKTVEWIANNCVLKQSGARDITHVIDEHLLPIIAKHLSQTQGKGKLQVDIVKSKLALVIQK